MSATDAESTQTDEQDAERRPTMSDFRALTDRLAEVEAKNAHLRERVVDLEHRIEKDENGTECAHERVDDLDTQVEQGLEYAHKRIDAFAESGFKDTTPRENRPQTPGTAKNLSDYADTGTPKGWVIDSTTISKVLAAQEGESPHTETVSRVIDFLDGFGKDDMKTKIHKGRRITVFDAEAAKRYRNGTTAPSQCGVISSQVTG